MEFAVMHREDPHGGVFFIERAGVRVGEMSYQRNGGSQVTIDHTFVDPALRGQGVARQLLDAAVAWARATGTRLAATCSYVTVQFARDRSLQDVIA